MNLRGHQFAAEEINDFGGIQSLNSAAIRLLIADTRGDPARARNETIRLIEEGVVALVGAYQSVTTFTATEIAEQYHVPFLISTALADILTERGHKYTFRTEPSQSQFVLAQFQFLRESGFDHSTRIVLLYENTLWGQSTAKVQRDVAKAKGYTNVGDIAYPYQLKNLSLTAMHIAKQIRRVMPDVILHSSYLHDSVKLARSFKKVGVRPKAIIGTGAGSKDPEFANSLGRDAQNWMVVNEWSGDMQRAGTQRLNERFRRRFGEDMNGIAAVSYVGIWILKEAIEKCASTDGETLRTALATLHVHGGPATILPMGRVIFDAKGNNAAMPIITQIQHGKQRTVWPRELASVRPVFSRYFSE